MNNIEIFCDMRNNEIKNIDKYYKEIMDYIDLDPSKLNDLCEKFRSLHITKKENGKWKLRHSINLTGTDD